MSHPHRTLGLVVLALVLPGCGEDPPHHTEPEPEQPAVPKPPDPVVQALQAPPPPAACPADMLLVEGRFCPAAEQVCLEHHPDHKREPETSERCLRFQEPSRCLSEERVLMRFCVDRYEWPNRAGELPSVLVDWGSARTSCESVGKRLCDESEWLFACEGEEMLPYVNGATRDESACVIDRQYVSRPRVLRRWDACMTSAECQKDFERVDQREPAGAFPACVSPFGAFDMNGNVNEWVNVPDAAPPRRSGLKGGWWGPVRNRCRPTVRFHDEADWGYEIGFRCCRNAMP